MLSDLRSALTQIRRAPSFAIIATLTLALGAGANTAVFSVINGFFRPLPVPDADRIVVVANVLPGDETGLRFRFSFPALEDFRRQTDVFSDVFGHDTRIGGLSANGRTLSFLYSLATGNYFTGLRLTPAAGRLFVPGEGEHANADAVIVLGYSYWMSHFGGDRAVVGKAVRLNGRPARIIGVAPKGFVGLVSGTEMDGYVPYGVDLGDSDTPIAQQFTDRSRRPIIMAARMQPGVTIGRAQAAIDVFARRLALQYPATDEGSTARVMPEPLARPLPLTFLMTLVPTVRLLLFVLGGLVLLIACMNVANLLFVRATVRQREMAVRASLGAGRARLVRLLLVESLLLAFVGAVIGLAFAQVVSGVFLRSIHIGTDVPLRLDFTFDWRVFAYALLVAIVTGIVVGVVPALRASRADVTQLLHDGGRSGSAGPARQRTRSALVMAQVAGSLALLIVAGLFVQSLRAAQQVNLGFDAAHVMTARLDTVQVGYNAARSARFYDDLDRRLRALPGVESASQSFSIPLGYFFTSYQAGPAGAAKDGGDPREAIGTNFVSPEYLETMKIPIVQGRAFTDRDAADSTRVVIVNGTLAARFWPGQNPIGKRVEVPRFGEPAWQVVGVAKDSKYLAVFETSLPYLYIPLAQSPTFLRTIQVRSSTMPDEELKARVAREIAALEPDMPIADLHPLREMLDGNIGFVLFRVGVWQATAMSVLGLVLAVVGVYGVVSYRTAQRGREIGIRVALGALPVDVRRLVLGQGLGLVGGGLLLGLALSFLASQSLKTVLTLVSTTDPITFAAVPLVVGATALVACYLPARRAMRVEAAEILRHE